MNRNYIQWNGRSTNGRWKRKTEAESFIELYHQCLLNGAISEENYDPYVNAVIEKAGKSEDDFLDEYGYFDPELYNQWNNGNYDLTDMEIWLLISHDDGMAYYQTFQRWDEDAEEWREIEKKDFDKNGVYICNKTI